MDMGLLLTWAFKCSMASSSFSERINAARSVWSVMIRHRGSWLCGVCRGGQLRHQAKPGGDIVQLKMRTQKQHARISARLARHFFDFHGRFAQRMTRLGLERSIVAADA